MVFIQEIIYLEHIPKENKTFTGNKNIMTNIYRIQAYDSTMCGYFCIGFIDFMLNGKSLLDYAILFSPNIFSITKKMKKFHCVIFSKYRKFEKPKI